MKKTVVLALCFALCAVIGAFATGTKEAAKGPIELTFALELHPDDIVGADKPWFKALAEKTGINLKIISMPPDTVAEKRNLILASGDIPDLMTIGSAAVANQYAAEKVFVAYDDLMDKYGPNLKKWLGDKLATVHLRNPADGLLYVVPKVVERLKLNEWSYNYRKDMLDAVGLKEPNTFDEWYTAFKAIKAKYPGSIPLSQRQIQNWNGVLWYGAWDLAMLSGQFGFLLSQMDQGKVIYLPATDNYKQMLQYFAKLYSEGLLDKEYLTMSYDQWVEGIQTGKIFSHWTNGYRAWWSEDICKKNGITQAVWVAGATPMGITGKRQVPKTIDIFFGGASTALSAKSKYPKEAVQFLDFMYSDLGSDMDVMGIEGVSYKKVGSTYEKIPNDDTWSKKRTELGFGLFIPAIEAMKYTMVDLKDVPQALDGYDKNTPHTVSMPILKAVPALQEELNKINTDLNTYIATMNDKFIMGKESFANWDAYLKEIDRMNAKRGVEIVQTYYDNYLKSIGKK